MCSAQILIRSPFRSICTLQQHPIMTTPAWIRTPGAGGKGSAPMRLTRRGCRKLARFVTWSLRSGFKTSPLTNDMLGWRLYGFWESDGLVLLHPFAGLVVWAWVGGLLRRSNVSQASLEVDRYIYIYVYFLFFLSPQLAARWASLFMLQLTPRQFYMIIEHYVLPLCSLHLKVTQPSSHWDLIFHISGCCIFNASTLLHKSDASHWVGLHWAKKSFGWFPSWTAGGLFARDQSCVLSCFSYAYWKASQELFRRKLWWRSMPFPCS